MRVRRQRRAVGVSAYVVYVIATEDSAQSQVKRRDMPLSGSLLAPQAPGGLTLMRW